MNAVSRLVGSQIITDEELKKVIDKRWCVYTKPYHTGIDIFAVKVNNICKGVVLSTGKQNDRYIVCVQIDANNCIRYGNIKSLSVKAGQLIYYDDEIGEADEFVHFEHCTLERNGSNYPVRVNDITYYKQNPEKALFTDYLSDLVGYSKSGLTVVDKDTPAEHIELDKFQLDEFTGNRGKDDINV